jgi:DNA-binding CsgD family transcriptional regulator
MLQLASSAPSTAPHVPAHAPAFAAHQAASAAHGLADDHTALARWLSQTLDHVGRGMLLVTLGGRVLHANRLARQSLEGLHALKLDQGRLRAATAHDTLTLMEALDAAMHRGLRRMLQLRPHPAAEAITVAVLPLDAQGGGGAALVSLPQAGRTQDLAVHSFARQHGFSSAETQVLEALLAGRRPGDIAKAKGVKLSTVRTQIGQLRLKCGAHSIRELLDRVAALPPMMAVVQ